MWEDQAILFTYKGNISDTFGNIVLVFKLLFMIIVMCFDFENPPSNMFLHLNSTYFINHE